MRPSHPPRQLLLDFDGVLATYSRPIRLARLADHAGCSAERVHQALFVSGLETAYDGGQIDTVEYLDRLGHALGARIDEATWLSARVGACRPVAAVVDGALRLARRMRVAVLTNNGPLMAHAIERIVPELFPALAGRVFCSGQFGGRKPEREVYLRTLAALGEGPRETRFVDDLFVNVRGARAAGLWADTARDPRAFRRVLARHHLTP